MTSEFINKVICGDCLEIMRSLDNESIDLVFTDPPYNVSRKNKIYREYRSGKRKDISFDFGEWDYDFQIEPFLQESKRVLKNNGSVIVWTSEKLFGKYYEWFEKNMYPKQLLVWVKTNPLPQFRLVGYRRATELMYWALKKKNTKNNENFLFLKQKEMNNVFYAPIVGGNERTEHPTQKPLSISQEIIKRHCREDGIVLDPFMGSGTTCLAAKNLKRNFIGIEIDPKYYEIARNRIYGELFKN